MSTATQDKGFKLPSPEAQRVHTPGCALLKWATTNILAMQHTTEALAKEIESCFKKPPTTKLAERKC